MEHVYIYKKNINKLHTITETHKYNIHNLKEKILDILQRFFFRFASDILNKYIYIYTTI